MSSPPYPPAQQGYRPPMCRQDYGNPPAQPFQHHPRKPFSPPRAPDVPSARSTCGHIPPRHIPWRGNTSPKPPCRFPRHQQNISSFFPSLRFPFSPSPDIQQHATRRLCCQRYLTIPIISSTIASSAPSDAIARTLAASASRREGSRSNSVTTSPSFSRQSLSRIITAA